MKEMVYEWDQFEYGLGKKTYKLRLLKFRDELSRKDESKPIDKKTRQPLTVLTKRTLTVQPASPDLNLIRDSGLPLRLLSRHSISLLESEFRRAVKLVGLTRTDLMRWFNREEIPGRKEEIVSKIRGSIFEEVVTREFVDKNPNYFVTNPVLTSKLITPILKRYSAGDLVLPDHLVFRKNQGSSTLVGFIEDKKVIRFTKEEDLLKQVEGERKVFALIAQDDSAQIQFRRLVQENIPSFPFRIRIAPLEESRIWLALIKEADFNLNKMPYWMLLFKSSVSARAINNLSNALIEQKFLPRVAFSFRDNKQ